MTFLSIRLQKWLKIKHLISIGPLLISYGNVKGLIRNRLYYFWNGISFLFPMHLLFVMKISFVSLGDVRLIIRDLFLFHELITSRLHDILLNPRFNVFFLLVPCLIPWENQPKERDMRKTWDEDIVN